MSGAAPGPGMGGAAPAGTGSAAPWEGLDDGEVLDRFSRDGTGGAEGDALMTAVVSMLPWCGSPDLSGRAARRGFLSGDAARASVILYRCATEPWPPSHLAEVLASPGSPYPDGSCGWRLRAASAPDPLARIAAFAHDRPQSARMLLPAFRHAAASIPDVTRAAGDGVSCTSIGEAAFLIGHTAGPLTAILLDGGEASDGAVLTLMALGITPGDDCGYGGYTYDGPAATPELLDAIIGASDRLSSAGDGGSGPEAHLGPAILTAGRVPGETDRGPRVIEDHDAVGNKRRRFAPVGSMPPLDFNGISRLMDAPPSSSGPVVGGDGSGWLPRRVDATITALEWIRRRGMPVRWSDMAAVPLIPCDGAPDVSPLRVLLMAACKDGDGGLAGIFDRSFPFAAMEGGVGEDALMMAFYLYLVGGSDAEGKASAARDAVDSMIIYEDLVAAVRATRGWGGRTSADIRMTADTFLDALDDIEAGLPLDFITQNLDVSMSEGRGKGDEPHV